MKNLKTYLECWKSIDLLINYFFLRKRPAAITQKFYVLKIRL